MCRWVVYQGDPIPLSTIMVDAQHSLVTQSLHSKEKVLPAFMQPKGVQAPNFATNGDGFGIAWMTETGEVGRFRESMPAWDSPNLGTLTPHLSSGLFMGHLRAAPGSAISTASCHPFVHDNWMFQHNGGIGGFSRLKQGLISQVDPDLYPFVSGTTDSELAFYLALSKGLRQDPVAGLLALHDTLEDARADAGSTTPWAGTIAVTGGDAVYVMRVSSRTNMGDHEVEPSPSLFYTVGPVNLVDGDCAPLPLPAGSRIIASEPLVWPFSKEEWVEFPDFSVGVFEVGKPPVITAIPERKSR